MTTTPVKVGHSLRNAWISVALMPVSLFVADGLLHAILGLLGVDEGAGEPATLLQSLLAGIPYALTMMLPGIGAFWFGTNTLGRGDGRGRIPSVIGVVWMLLVVVGSVAFLVMSQVNP